LQLQAFAEKTSSEQYWSVTWTIQCVIGREYLATIIGWAWLVILRNGRTQFMAANDTQWDRIDQFSDMIEWEVHNGDTLISTGFPVTHYLDDSDFSTLYDLAQESWKMIHDEIVSTMNIKLENTEMQYVNVLRLDSDLAYTTSEVSKRLEGPVQKIVTLLWWAEKSKSVAMFAGIALLAVILLTWLIKSFSASTTSSFVTTQTGSPVAISIESIQKEIADFQNMPADSDQKALVYEWIVQKLDTLDTNDKWTNDVAELRRILETQYYQWFNIMLVNNDSFFKDPIYRFTQQEKNVMGVANSVFFTDTLMVWWQEGALIWAINETLRGTLVSAAIDQQFSTCSLNIYRNGLYCVDGSNDIYMVSKSWVEPVNTSWAFPNSIIGLWIYGNRNLYTLTSDPELVANGSLIQRYSAEWSQTQFGEWLQYLMGEWNAVWSGVQSMAIDGTFMIWDPLNGLTQLRRDGVSTAFSSRTLDLWWGSILQQYSDQTKVLSFEESNYVYLFDPVDQSFTVYRSTPYKTNTSYTTSYELQYFFRIKFAIDDFIAKDVYVEEWEQAMLHVLTDNGVYKLRLWEYRNDYMRRLDQ
jgi:hypothetical protein